jgi:DNA processing protein
MTTTASHTGFLLAFIEAALGPMSSKNAHRVSAILDQLGATEPWSSHALGQLSETDRQLVNDAQQLVTESQITHWTERVRQLAAEQVTVITAGTDDYPTNLRLVPNRPPVLFVKGQLHADDVRSIAIVGTRKATDAGMHAATRVATIMAKYNVTVISGLAEGIDTAAHTAALDAGGRTVAVYGTGINKLFPASNRALAQPITQHGACVSQWWPDQPGTKWTFPLRNIVTSGLSLGTVVIEAGETSGARLQAQDARKHGRRLFLFKDLVTRQPWAQALEGAPGVHVVNHPSDILELIDFDLQTEAFSVA